MGFILIKVGSGSQNDVIINNPVISEEHCELFADIEGNVFLTDLSSAYGTFINDNQIVDSVELLPSDKVMLANTLFLDWQNYIEIQKGNTFSIGASSFNRIVFESTSVNEFHAEIIKDFKGNIILTDLKSSTGTFVNGTKINEPVFLAENDEVKVGDCFVDWQSLFKNMFTGVTNKIEQLSEQPDASTDEPVNEKNEILDRKPSFFQKYKEVILIWTINFILMYLFSLLI